MTQIKTRRVTESLRNETHSRGADETVRHCNGRTIPETPEHRASFRPARLSTYPLPVLEDSSLGSSCNSHGHTSR